MVNWQRDGTDFCLLAQSPYLPVGSPSKYEVEQATRHLDDLILEAAAALSKEAINNMVGALIRPTCATVMRIDIAWMRPKNNDGTWQDALVPYVHNADLFNGTMLPGPDGTDLMRSVTRGYRDPFYTMLSEAIAHHRQQINPDQ